MCNKTFFLWQTEGWGKGGEEEVVGKGTGSPGQRRRTDGQPAACHRARTEVGTVPRLAAASGLPGERMNPPYSTLIRVRDVEKEKEIKKAASYTKLTCVLRLQGQMSKVHPLTCLTSKNRIKPFSWRFYRLINGFSPSASDNALIVTVGSWG